MLHLDESDEYLDMWKERQTKYIQGKKEPWGFKDPGIADVPSLINEWLKLDPHIILCTRDWEDTIKSFMKFKKVSREEAEERLTQRDKNTKDALKSRPFLTIDCYEKDKEKIIKTWLTANNIVI
jgi:dephospho-CoA kinase